jgi:hypothetical protein
MGDLTIEAGETLTIASGETSRGSPTNVAGQLNLAGQLDLSFRFAALGEVATEGTATPELLLVAVAPGEASVESVADPQLLLLGTADGNLRVDGTVPEPTFIIPLNRASEFGIEYDRETDEFDLG